MVACRQIREKNDLKEERAEKGLAGWDQKERQVKIFFHQVSVSVRL